MKFLKIFLLFCLVAGIYSCQKETSVELSGAKGLLKSDVTDDCLPILIKGTYAKDTVLRDSNYVEIQVDVTETGSYFIKTDTLNGYGFSATGSFDDVGLHTVRLQGLGKPVSGGLNTFAVEFDGDTCRFDIVVNGSGGGGGGGATSCGNTATDYVLATIGGNCTLLNSNIVAVFDNTTFPGASLLDITGENIAGDTIMNVGILFPGTSIPPGSYDVNTPTYLAGGYLTVPAQDYAAETGSPNPTPVFTITITSITATRAVGSFSGALFDNVGAGPGTILITGGAFDVPL